MDSRRAGSAAGRSSLRKRAAQAPIRFYRRFLSPLKPPTCRFYPTCSQYALESIEVHGVLKGLYLAVRRIVKCHPFHPGGIDYVPPRRDKRVTGDPACGCGHGHDLNGAEGRESEPEREETGDPGSFPGGGHV
ncbi:hypothetical protein J31TS4_09170 [Paenibacillus sp. J31TS4]|nr:hypothetical protein J31TS4_09170 [Paenibacillus sp. J31TS4]